MKRFLRSLTLAALLAAPAGAFAQDATTKPEPVDHNTGALTLTGGADLTTAYFFRGYNQEDGGIIFQPYLTGTFAVKSTDSFTLNAYLGTWNSIQSHDTLAGPTGPSSWYESDIFGGVDFVFGKWSVGAVYTIYTYPGGAFNNIQELGFKAGYDDSETMKQMNVPFALKPFIGIYFETADDNGTEDTYLEAGVNPSFALGQTGVTLSVPCILGMSVDDYYLDSNGGNSFFGYGAIGLVGSIPIGERGKYGAWTLSAGVQYMYLFADSTEAANGGDNDQVIGKVGVSFAY